LLKSIDTKNRLDRESFAQAPKFWNVSAGWKISSFVRAPVHSFSSLPSLSLKSLDPWRSPHRASGGQVMARRGGPARRLASSSLRQAWRICVAAADDSSKVLQGGVTQARQRAATRVLLQNNDDGMGAGSSKILQARRCDPGTIERRIYAAAADGSSSLSAWPMVASFLDLQQRPMVTSFLDAWI
jgi:hypothetical protein